MQIFGEHGIRVSCEDDVYVDSFGIRNKNVLITHSHSDHARITNSNQYFLTKESAALLSALDKENVNCVQQKKSFDLNGFKASFHNSGHICGSSQILLENSNTVAITSDFKTQENILTKPAEPLSADLLLIETTYGKPEYSFAEREETYSEMRNWVNEAISKNRFVILGGYSTGKAQELTKFCNEYLDIVPLTYKKVYEKNRALSDCGVNLGDYTLLSHNFNDSDILIMPPHLVNDSLLTVLSHQLGKKVSVALATGQRFSKYKKFELSDHADFKQLVNYVEESRPKMVFTHHGHADYFARYIRRKLGIPAQPLSKAQKNLLEFSS